MVAYRCTSGISDSELPDAVARMLAHTKGGTTLLLATEAGKGRYNPKLLEAIDWAIEVDEDDRPQSVEAWRQALAGGGRRQDPVKPVRKPATQSTKDTTTGRSGTNWSTVALTIVIVALLGVGGWWGWQEYPELFIQGEAETPAVTEQATPAEIETVPPDAIETKETIADTGDAPPPEKAEAEQSTPKEPALTPKEAEVARLLAAAETDLKARRLTSPAGNNAWEKYQHVLSLSPAHPEAMAGMERVIGSYMELFGTAVEQEDFEKATGYLAKIGELHPDSPVLEEGEQSLAAAKQARTNRLAEQERQRQAEMERQRIAQAVEKHWQAFEAALGEENLSKAAEILTQVSALNPEEPGLATGEQRLEVVRVEMEQQRAEAIQAHWAAFEAAIQAEDPDKATGILAQVRTVNPDEPGLAGGEQRLEAAQAELERKRQEALNRELAGEMVSIPGGTFRMGDLSGEGDDDERPAHTVTVPAFMMGKYEVTVGQFRRFVEATEYRTDAERNADGNEGCYIDTSDGWDWTWGRSWQNPGYAIDHKQPVVCVSWNDAQAFIEWLTEKTGESYRLPSEAEWEYAARAGSTTKYHFGNSESQLCRYANHADSSTGFDWRNKSCSDGVGKRTATVGRYQPNAFGLYDIHGNVWEWVQDCWNDSYAEAPTDGRVWTRGGCSQHVARGGAWYSSPGNLSSADRDWASRSRRNDFLGFSPGPGQVNPRQHSTTPHNPQSSRIPVSNANLLM